MDIATVSLLQITDSSFPTGAFAHSWGLETYVSEGLVNDMDSLYEFIESFILYTTARLDAASVKLAHEYTRKKEISSLCRLDRIIHTMKFPSEVRQGSIQTGRQLLRLINELKSEEAILQTFSDKVQRRAAVGHHSVVYGLVCNTLKIPKSEAILAYLYSTVSSLVGAALRLLPIGHTEGQKIIERIKPLLVNTVEIVLKVNINELTGFSPGIDIRAMRHERLYTRLFRS